MSLPYHPITSTCWKEQTFNVIQQENDYEILCQSKDVVDSRVEEVFETDEYSSEIFDVE